MMHFAVVGLNHASAPLELRERISYTDDARAAALNALKQFCAEAVILDTCNRSEVYALATERDELAASIQDFLCNFHNLSARTLQPHLYEYSQQRASAHLFSVAAGIDSLVVGEAQVLAQVRAAFEFAAARQSCGPIFSALFRHALRVGKRARTETAINRGSVSLSTLAIERAQQVMGTLTGCTVLLIGTGKMSALAARYLHSLGVGQLLVANRTLAHAQELAQQVGGSTLAFEQVEHSLADCDVIFSATGAPHLILSYEMVVAAMRERTQPLCIVDFALPRDVDPRVANLTNIHLIDLDDLRALAAVHLAQRRAEVCKVQAIVADEVETFWRWLQSLSVTPTIAALRERAEQIRQSELADHLNRLQDLSPHDKRVIETMTASIVGRLLHEPTLRLRARASEGNGGAYAAVMRELFGLDDL